MHDVRDRHLQAAHGIATRRVQAKRPTAQDYFLAIFELVQSQVLSSLPQAGTESEVSQSVVAKDKGQSKRKRQKEPSAEPRADVAEAGQPQPLIEAAAAGGAALAQVARPRPHASLPK